MIDEDTQLRLEEEYEAKNSGKVARNLPSKAAIAKWTEKTIKMAKEIRKRGECQYPETPTKSDWQPPNAKPYKKRTEPVAPLTERTKCRYK